MNIFGRNSPAARDVELLRQSKLFDREFYLELYPDVAAAGVDPARHYLEFGAAEGRRPHYAFDSDWYLSVNPDVKREGWNPLLHYLKKGAEQGRRAHKRTVVYTAITGFWDDLRSPAVIDPDIDYVVFADQHLPQVPKPWVRRSITRTFSDDRLTSRYSKITPHLHVPEYEISIWVDAAYQIRDIARGMETVSDDWTIAAFRHPVRDCAYAEAKEVIEAGHDRQENVDRVIAQLKKDGFATGAGLYENGLLLRRHHDPAVVRAMNQWWDLVSTGSHRDQISFNYCLWKNRVSCAILPGSSRRNQFALWMGHRPRNEAEARIRLIELEREIVELYRRTETREDQAVTA